MKAKLIESVGLALLTSRPLSAASGMAGLLSRMCAHEDLIPQKCGLYDPLNVPFDPNRIERICSELADCRSFYWKRNKPKVEGLFKRGDSGRHATLRMTAWNIRVCAAFIDFVRSEAIALGADIAAVEPHWVGELGSSSDFFQRSTPSMTDEEFDRIGSGYYTLEVQDFLVQLKWLTVFGPPYVRMFGREKLLSAPCAVSEEIAPEVVYLQLTPTIDDVTDNLHEYFALRRRVKSHIGSDAFFEPAKGTGPYRVPEFALERSEPKPLGMIDGYPVVGWVAGRPVVQTPEGTKMLEGNWPLPGFDQKLKEIRNAQKRLREISEESGS